MKLNKVKLNENKTSGIFLFYDACPHNFFVKINFSIVLDDKIAIRQTGEIVVS
jgi:hypothetical protein